MKTICICTALVIFHQFKIFNKVCFIYITDSKVLSDVRKVVGDPSYIPTDDKELAGLVFTTCYMGSENSSKETQSRAAELAQQIGRSDI